jgi:glycosyltransferase involved in cell wall biosynthesis
MNIGIDAHMLGHNETGNETYILELVRSLAQRESGDTFTVYVENPDALPPEAVVAPHIRVMRYNTRSGFARLLRELPEYVVRDKLDVLHVSYNAPPRVVPGCALVVTIHDISFEEHGEWFPHKLRAFLRWSVPRSARRAHVVLTDTECAKQELVRLYQLAPGKIHVTPYAAARHFRPIADTGALARVRARYKTSDKYVLAVSNMQPRKNLARLMQAFTMARARYSVPHRLVLVGQPLWLYGPLVRQARELGDSVIMTGYVPDADLPLLYNAADVFCYPSLYEGFGLPVLEAMACGTPVITSHLSSLPEVAGNAARLVNPYDTEELARALGELLTDENARANLKSMGIARARSFSWERTAKQTVEAYYTTKLRHSPPHPDPPGISSSLKIRD